MDAYVHDESVFTAHRLQDLFETLTQALQMTALGPCHVYQVPVDPLVLERVRQTGVFEDEGGITGVQVISTSHMTLHAWPLQKFFSLDTFSCKDFDFEAALQIIRDQMGVTGENTLIVQRHKPVDGVTRVRYEDG